MFVDRNFAKKIETMNAMSHRFYTQDETNCLGLSSGGAFFSGQESFFSQVVGWGFDASEEEIDVIETFYKERSAKVAIEYCTLARIDILNSLLARGYWVSEFNNVSILDLSTLQTRALATDFEYRLCNTAEVQKWGETVAEGFSFSQFTSMFIRYGQIQEVYPFGAFYKTECIGGAAIAIHGDICDLGMASTLLQFRGRRIQQNLLLMRLAFAAQKGVRWASVNTEPGSISDNNVRKLGFQTIYSRFKLEHPENRI